MLRMFQVFRAEKMSLPKCIQMQILRQATGGWKKNCAKVSLRFQCLVVSCLQGILLALLVDNTEGMEWAFSMKK